MLPLAVPLVQTAPSLDPRQSAAAWPADPTDASLSWDVAHGQGVSDPTTVRIATDGKFIYVRFDAVQHEPVIANQHSNDLISGGSNTGGGIAWSDDSVWVDLWPTGPGGFQYLFESNANGAHNEASTENVQFAPDWDTRGAITANGYVVTMAIPLAVVHGAHPGNWRLQFVRYVRSTGALEVWSYDKAQTNPDDAAHAGVAAIPLVARAPLPKPRLGLYALGKAASGGAGGSTSRMGADFSIPVTQTAAFFGTFHPDYSNVELDQQSISPTVYQRIFSEVRPFFTQAAGYYNNFNCNVCNGFRTTLYTPAIPTPRSGYAFEGKQGNFGLAAFDAIGVARNDAATALNWTSDDTHWGASFQHIAANLTGITDNSNEAGVNWWNGKYLSFYTNFATDATSAVDPATSLTGRSNGNWIDAGGGWGNQHFALYGSVRKVGAGFNPVDGFDSHPGIAGYGLYGARVWTFSPNDVLSSAGFDVFLDRYHDVNGGIGQSDNSVLLDVLTKSSWDFQAYSGSNYWLFNQNQFKGTPFYGLLTPISQNGGFSITYHSGMQNNLNNFPTHGASSTPTSIQYATGRYGFGRLDSWFRNSTVRIGDRGYLTLSVDNTAQWLPHANANIQWFDGLSYAYQVGPNSSFALGVRRVIGFPPQPNGGGNCEGVCSNISLAYHMRLRNEELYMAYGDPNTLVTVPQAIFKIIFYAGGQKGT